MHCISVLFYKSLSPCLHCGPQKSILHTVPKAILLEYLSLRAIEWLFITLRMKSESLIQSLGTLDWTLDPFSNLLPTPHPLLLPRLHGTSRFSLNMDTYSTVTYPWNS